MAFSTLLSITLTCTTFTFLDVAQYQSAVGTFINRPRARWNNSILPVPMHEVKTN